MLKEPLKTIKAMILEMSHNSSLFIVSSKDFSRNRKLSFMDTILFTISMGGQSFNKELYHYFKSPKELMTTSAYIQQRRKILTDAYRYILREFNDRCNDIQTKYGYGIYAVDGSALNIPANPNSDTYFENGDSDGFNQFHINTFYNVLSKTYIVSAQ